MVSSVVYLHKLIQNTRLQTTVNVVPLCHAKRVDTTSRHHYSLTQIDNVVDHVCAVAWIKTFHVLHTLIFEIENGNKGPDYVQELMDEGSDPNLKTFCCWSNL